MRQLRRVRRSLDTQTAATLVHAFVTHRIDYCNVFLAWVPKATTDKLQRLLNAAARLISGTKKFDRGLSQVMHVDLHWLDVPERVKYKLVTMVYNCLHGKAPSYLTDCCTPISDVASRCHLCSASRRQLIVPRHNLSTIHIWSSGFFCRRSGCMELPVRRTAQTVVTCEQFQTVT